MKDDRLQHTIDLLKRCGEAKGMTITDEEMAGKIGLSVQQLQAYIDGEEIAPDRLGPRLKAAYNDLITAIKQDGYRDSLQSAIKAIKGMGKNMGVTITEEEMAGRIDMPLTQLQAYINDEQPTPRNMALLLRTAYDDLYKEIQQRSLNGRLRSAMDVIQRKGAKEGQEITREEMARHLRMTGEELAACLHDPGKTYEEFTALADRLWAAYPELLKNVRSVTYSTQLQVKTRLHIELERDEHWDEVLGE